MNRSMMRVGAAAVLAVFSGTSAWSAPAKAGAGQRKKPMNVVIFAVDGLRADRLGLYGYSAHPVSPNIDRLAQKAVVFLDAESQAGWTLPSFTSLFTSRYPQRHGTVSADRRISDSERLLAEVFKDAGYRTAGSVGGPFLNPEYGFARGFDVYNAGGERRFRETMAPALEWMHVSRKKPFFLFIHGNDVHPPFNPSLPEAVRSRFDPDYQGPANNFLLDYYFVKVFNRVQAPGGPAPSESYLARVEEIRKDPRSLGHINALYDSLVRDVDDSFQLFWKALEKDDLLKNTIVILTSDHGLELGERGLLGTGFHPTLFETITHVPLIVWQPGLEPRRVAGAAQLVDVAPTLLDMLGLPAQPAFEGKSLLAAARGEAVPERTVFGAGTIVGGGKEIPLYFARKGALKLLFRSEGASSELYDVSADPGERKDLSSSKPAEVLSLSSELLKNINGER